MIHSLSRMLLLLCVAFLLQRCSRPVQFTLVPAAETGLDFTNQIVETPENNIMTYQYMYNGAGVAAGDLNNDGLPDIYVCGNSVPGKLFLNKGNWKFTDITAAANITERAGWKTGVTLADVNGDGWLDIYICYSGNTEGEGMNKPVLIDNPRRRNQLFINHGCVKGGIPTFTEEAAAYGIDAPGTYSTQAYFFDYDKDGDLDLFLVDHANTFYSSLFNTTKLRNLRHPYFGNKLFRNDKNKFTDVSAQAGIFGSGLNYGLSAAISDLNGDNWPDIYVTNDYDEQDFCYINNKDGTFKEVSHAVFGHISKYSMGTDVADINNDGLPDIFVADMLPEDNRRQKLLKGGDEYDKYTLAYDSGYHHQNMRNTLQLNKGLAPDSLPRFSEVGQLSGVSNTDWSWGPLLADFDNDGYKDLFTTNGYLHDYTNMDFLKFAGATILNRDNEQYQSDLFSLIKKMPSTKLNKYIFRNVDGLHFENKTEDWGFTQKAVSNGGVYADLDNDGDLDLIVNNLNDGISVYRNNEEKIQKNNFIKIKLAGLSPNTFGVGAKVWITVGDKQLFQEANFSRGYESSVEPVLTIGVGKATTLKGIKVLWPDDRITQLSNIACNQTIVIGQKEASPGPRPVPVITSSFLKDVLPGSGIDFVHQQNKYVDFKYQRLLPYQPSRLGGKLAVGDVNKDGNDDVFFGGSVGHPGVLYLGRDDGSFVRAPAQPWEAETSYADMSALFFDADGDGDLDLYVVSGGNQYGAGDPLYQDRLYINDGKGGFTRNNAALPPETTSGSCVTAFDYDKDGDLDLFVGGRVAAQLYPFTPRSFILRNDSKNGVVKFTDVTSQLSPELQLAGMVTDAVWTDIDHDSWPDLVLVGEWMPVRVFHNEKGARFTEISAGLGLKDTEGWWTRILPADVDGDGDMDFVLGNAGDNLPFHASVRQPVECYVQDINSDGQIDPILCYYVQGKSYPMPSMDELLIQAPPLRKKFYKYADYANATIEDVLGKSGLSQSHYLKAVTLRSSWLENKGNGQFELKPLPDELQTSMINGFVYDDFDGDHHKELLAAGNFYPYRVQIGPSDAFMGGLVKFDKGASFIYKPAIPLWLTGDIRDMALMRTKRGLKRVVVSRNNDAPGLYEYK